MERVTAWHPQPHLTTWPRYLSVSPPQRSLLCALSQTSVKWQYLEEAVTYRSLPGGHRGRAAGGAAVEELLGCRRSLGGSRHERGSSAPRLQTSPEPVTVQRKPKWEKKQANKRKPQGEHLYFWSAPSRCKQTNDSSQPSCLHQQLLSSGDE